MWSRIENGWVLMKASARALNADRELLVFPLVSALATVIVALSFVVPIVTTGIWQAMGDDLPGRILGGSVLWLFYFALALVTIFCNTALVGAALIRLEGGDPTLGDGLRVAGSRLGTIVGYSAISATVGLALKFLQRRGGRVQSFVISLVGVAWSLATFLVVPVLAANDLGPIEAIKRSGSLFRKTWGEQVVGSGGIKIISGLATGGLILLAIPCMVLAATSQNAAVMIAVGGIFGLALGLLALVTAALQGIYTAALYRYATNGEASFGFEAGQLAGSFRPRR